MLLNSWHIILIDSQVVFVPSYSINAACFRLWFDSAEEKFCGNRVQQGEKLMIIDPFEIAFFDEVVYDRFWPTFVMDAVA